MFVCIQVWSFQKLFAKMEYSSFLNSKKVLGLVLTFSKVDGRGLSKMKNLISTYIYIYVELDNLVLKRFTFCKTNSVLSFNFGALKKWKNCNKPINSALRRPLSPTFKKYRRKL